MARVSLIAAVGLGVALNGGCGRRAALPDTTVRIAVTSEPRTLLPAFASSLVEGQVADLLFDRLADPAPGASPFDDGAYTPGLAERWSWDASRTVLTVRLDSTARWHDGEAVTSADVRFTFQLLRDSTLGSRKAVALQTVDSVSTPDARTAVVWCRRPSATLFHDLTFGTHILPAHLLDTIPPARLLTSAAVRHPIGSGPFRFVRWDRGVAIRLARAPGYRRLSGTLPDGMDAAGRRVDEIVVRLYPGYDAALAGLVAHDVDVLSYVRPNDAARLARRPDLAVRSAPGYDYVDLRFNLRARGFDDRALRRALAMAVDRRALAANVLGTHARVALGPVTRAMHVADTAAAADATPAFDPGAARLALEALGWRAAPDGIRQRGGARLAFDLLVPSSSASRRQAAVVLQAMFRTVGAQAAITVLDPAAFQSALERGAFETALEGMTADPSPAQVRELWSTRAGVRHGTEIAGFNFGGFADAAVDATLDSANASPSAAAATRLYRRAYRILTSDVPAIFLYETDASIGVSRRIVDRDLQPATWWTRVAAWRVSAD